MTDDDMIERFRMYSERFKQASLAGEFYLDTLQHNIIRLRKERDEARRRVCEDAIWNGCVCCRVGSDTVRCETSKEVAKMMGWDCFKEATDER